MTIASATLIGGVVSTPLQYGLFSVFSYRPEGDSRWSNGVKWELAPDGAVGGIGQYDDDSRNTPGLPKVLDVVCHEVAVATPFTVYGHYSGSPVAHSFADAQGKALANLYLGEQARVEQAFWTGDLSNTPALQAASTTTLDAGAAVKMATALADLEAYLAANYGAVGVIHMTRGMATFMLGAQLLVTRGNLLYTKLGQQVVAGTGYPGTGPTGQAVADHKGWVYATPAMLGYRSEVFTSSRVQGDLLNRSTNTLYAIAERTYLLGFDPGVAAVLVDPLI